MKFLTYVKTGNLDEVADSIKEYAFAYDRIMIDLTPLKYALASSYIASIGIEVNKIADAILSCDDFESATIALIIEKLMHEYGYSILM